MPRHGRQRPERLQTGPVPASCVEAAGGAHEAPRTPHAREARRSVSCHGPASLFGECLRRQPRRPMSFQEAGSAPMASAALRASPMRNGTRPAATAALIDMPVESAR
ncbi:hypothetical protein SATRM34S_04686 [Streptomyces atroolivaceus]